MERIGLIITFTMIVLFSSCNRQQCENSNPILNQFDINSEEYKTELAKQLSKPENKNAEYWFDKYVVKDGKEYLIVSVQNESLCAKTLIRVKDWNGIDGIKRTKGKSYQGARLEGLSFDIENYSKHTEFIFNGIVRIVD